jgi:predicted GH43/DUF377 family glycosyl hydrolase
MGSKFHWEKRGQIFSPDGRYEWMQSHAQNPSVLLLEDRLRVYFTCRGKKDESGKFAAVATFVELARDSPGEVLYVHDRPLLPFGSPGTFDQFGVMPACVIRVGDEVWLYYVGWIRCEGVPYNHAIGLMTSTDGGVTFERRGRGPLFGRTLNEPFLQNSPFVMQRGDTFHMWYSSGIEWLEDQGRMESIYVLMHATSPDGINWVRESVPCIPYVVEYECQTNPTVMELDGRFHMWFCYRSGINFRNAERGYRIGYAWSDDLINWRRDDKRGELPPSAEGWDAQMVCYPCVVNIDGRICMFYSGNYFGRDGFGYATLASGESIVAT